MIKDDFMKKVLICIFVFLFFFTILMTLIFLIRGSVPDTLVIAVFGACAGEYSICGLIKNGKEKQKTMRMVNGLVDEESEHDGDIQEEELD